ncbi:MAG: hypothetical protein CEN87_50 [Parcubacteria group bacterium Licking1014_1]|nr:MAG: hypothetical protein CEN87_50 [Parcubacteria group bacterium Licking1014_1]
MAIVFISPKQRQKIFFLGIIILFLLVLVVISLSVFLAKTKEVPPEQVFNRPKINVNINILESNEIKGLVPFAEMETEFSYEALTEKGKGEKGKVLAVSIEEARKILEGLNLSVVKIEEVGIGRENPFEPYYQTITSTKTKKK